MIPFNFPYLTGNELGRIAEAHAGGQLAGDGPFTKRCHAWLERELGVTRALLTHSGTAALEMAALLLNLAPGDEVIMPSFTFVSTANAFVLRGAVPVFVDIRADTLNIDETLIEAAITPRTKAIVVVHYAGIACAMEPILACAARHGLKVVEDAAQGIMARYRGRSLGSWGDFGCLSFHETKNIIAGEGGALLLRDSACQERAEIIREKGTDRSRFFRGEVDKYTWQGVGSSYLPGELTAAFLSAQLDAAASITAGRLALFDGYRERLAAGAAAGRWRLPIVPADCQPNGHLFYVLLPADVDRGEVLARMRAAGVLAVFHYVPLHSSPAGKTHGRVAGSMAVTTDCAARLIRLPLWLGLTSAQQDRVAAALTAAVG